MNTDIENLGKLKAYFAQLHSIEKSLFNLKIHNKKFTLDGKLVSDFAEAFAITAFGLNPTDGTKKGYDATAPSDEKAEVNAVRAGQLDTKERFKNCEAKYVIIVYIDPESAELKPRIMYNGLFAELKSANKNRRALAGGAILESKTGLPTAEGFDSYFA